MQPQTLDPSIPTTPATTDTETLSPEVSGLASLIENGINLIEALIIDHRAAQAAGEKSTIDQLVALISSRLPKT